MGDGEPDALLVLEPQGAGHRTLLFVREHNRGTREFFTDRTLGELWVGRHRGVDRERRILRRRRLPTASRSRGLPRGGDADRRLARLMRSADDAVDAALAESDGDAELATYLAEMRLVKDDYELDELRAACALTKRGFEAPFAR